MKVALSNIKTTQLRRDHGDIADLKASIADVGIINPLTVDNNYNLLAGRRRFQAVSELGWIEVECRLLPVNGDQLKAFRIAMDENLKRKNLTDLEVATAIKEYDELKRKLEGEAPEQGGRPKTDYSVISYGWSQRKTARDLRISQSAVTKAIKIATAIEKYPELCAEKQGRLILRKAENLDRRAGKKTDVSPLEAWPGVSSFLLNQANRAVHLGLSLRRWCCMSGRLRKGEATAFPPAAAAVAGMEEAIKVAEGLIKAATAELQRVAKSAPTDPTPRPPSRTQTVDYGTGEAQVRNLKRAGVSRVAIVNSSHIGTKAGTRIYNLGSEKIAQYHRLRGDQVYYADAWVPMMLRGLDKFYFSVIFTWDIPEMIRQVNMVRDWGKDVEIGGPAATFMHKYIHKQTGIEPHQGLDDRFEHISGDYKLTFSSRGCPHKCPFCGVRKAEPVALEYEDFPLAPMVGDNNILATSWKHQALVVNKLVNYGREIDINSGFDIRFFTEEHLKLYSQLRLKYWRFAWDTMEVEPDVRRVAAIMRSNGLDRHRVLVYALIGFPGQSPEECFYRLNTIIKLGLCPFPMRFWPLNSLNRKYVAPGWTEKLLQRMTAYYQTPNLWKSVPWENYRLGKKT